MFSSTASVLYTAPPMFRPSPLNFTRKRKEKKKKKREEKKEKRRKKNMEHDCLGTHL
jgi:hypothetical protein